MQVSLDKMEGVVSSCVQPVLKEKQHVFQDKCHALKICVEILPQFSLKPPIHMIAKHWEIIAFSQILYKTMKHLYLQNPM